MTGETTSTRGFAQHMQDEIRRMTGVSLSQLGQSDRLLSRCRDQRHTQRMAARLIAADAALGEALGNAIAPPPRKAKTKRHQKHEGELNSHLAKLRTR